MLWFLLMLVTGFLTLRGVAISIATSARGDNIGGAVVVMLATGLLGWVTYLLGTAAFAT